MENEKLKKSVYFGLTISCGFISLILCMASGFIALAVSAWWVIGFVLCGLLAGVSISVAMAIWDEL